MNPIDFYVLPDILHIGGKKKKKKPPNSIIVTEMEKSTHYRKMFQ